MLNTISWPEFIRFFLAVIIAYYTIVVLLLYSRDIISRLRKKQVTNHDNVNNGKDDHETVMGSTHSWVNEHHVPREETTTTNEIITAPLHEPDEALTQAASPEITLIGTIADLLQDIHTLTPVTSNSSRQECTELFKTLFAKYPTVQGTEYETMINKVIMKACNENGPADFELTEIKSWWQTNRHA